MAITEQYTPDDVPRNASPELRDYLNQEFNKLADVLGQEVIIVQIRSAAPAKPFNGMLVYADGANWNPGAGLGFYGYENGAWVKL